MKIWDSVYGFSSMDEKSAINLKMVETQIIIVDGEQI